MEHVISVTEHDKADVQRFTAHVLSSASPLGMASLVIGSMVAVIDRMAGPAAAAQVLTAFAERTAELVGATDA